MNLFAFLWDRVPGLAAQQQGSFWMPPADSTQAAGVDKLFYFIFWVSLFFFVLIIGLLVVFLFKYRQRPGASPQKTPTHNTPLEITWTVIPLVLVLIIFYYGFRGYLDLYTPPANAYTVHVTGQKWKWLFTYPNGYVDENLHAPVDTPVQLVMTSDDVIHSLYIPNFRLKLDVVPGRYSKVWFQATAAGEYNLFCAEYCGTNHSNMLAKVIVHRAGEFEKWMLGAADIFKGKSLPEVGEYLYKVRGCAQCHTTNGTVLIGPTFQGIWGHAVKFTDGTSGTVDENYIRESIVNPAAKLVAGFQNVMPTFQGKLQDKEVTAVIEFIRSLGEPPKK